MIFDCISVVLNRFSPNFQYVVAETVLHKESDIYFYLHDGIMVKFLIKGEKSESNNHKEGSWYLYHGT